jgi:hypothetical protein
MNPPLFTGESGVRNMIPEQNEAQIANIHPVWGIVKFRIGNDFSDGPCERELPNDSGIHSST